MIKGPFIYQILKAEYQMLKYMPLLVYLTLGYSFIDCRPVK